MATKVAGLFVDVVARTQKFDNNIKRSAKNTKTFKGKVSTAALAVKGLAIAMGAVTVSRITGFVTKNLKAIDVLGKLSSRLGIAATDLQGYQLAARLSGIETETLNRSLEDMQKNLGEALVLGTGEAKEALKSLKLEVKGLAKVGTSEAFIRIAEAISARPTAAGRIALSRKIFGQDITNLLSLGRPGFQAARATVVGGGAALTAKQIKDTEQLNDAIERLSVSADAASLRLAAAVPGAAQQGIRTAIPTLPGFVALSRFLGIQGQNNNKQLEVLQEIRDSVQQRSIQGQVLQ